MIRKHVYLPEEDIAFLSKLEGNISEHIRRAIALYKKTIVNVSTSPSTKGVLHES